MASGGEPGSTLRIPAYVKPYCEVLIQELAALVKMRVDPAARGFYRPVPFVPAALLNAVSSEYLPRPALTGSD